MVCLIEIDNSISQTSGNSDEEYDSFNTPSSMKPSFQQADDAIEDAIEQGDFSNEPNGRPGGTTVFQTSLNVSKMCMGTGTLALPFAAEQGGLIFNVVGLGLIGLWNYYSANCLLRCLEFLPQIDEIEVKEVKSVVRGSSSVNEKFLSELEQQPVYGTIDSVCGTDKEHTKVGYAQIDLIPPPPDGTTTYGKVAWYASGPKGLMVVDLLMLCLFFGLVIAYIVAMQSFINDTPLSTGSRRVDMLIPSAIVALLSFVPDMGFLSKFSGMGLLAVGLSFVVISWQGFEENGCSGFRNTSELDLWPSSLSAASCWFGVVVFGYGAVPFVFNFRDSMANPQHIGLCLRIGLFMVYAGYVIISSGIRVLFSTSHVFTGDVLQAMPNTWVSLVVRLLMTFAVVVSAALIVVPCGELIEGKLGIDNTQNSSTLERILVRLTFCSVCTLFAEFLGSGFVHIVSFIGCFCVATVGFVLPPLFCIQLSNRKKSKSSCCGGLGIDSVFLCDAGVLVLGIIATVVTSVLTFRELLT